MCHPQPGRLKRGRRGRHDNGWEGCWFLQFLQQNEFATRILMGHRTSLPAIVPRSQNRRLIRSLLSFPTVFCLHFKVIPFFLPILYFHFLSILSFPLFLSFIFIFIHFFILQMYLFFSFFLFVLPSVSFLLPPSTCSSFTKKFSAPRLFSSFS